MCAPITTTSVRALAPRSSPITFADSRVRRKLRLELHAHRHRLALRGEPRDQRRVLGGDRRGRDLQLLRVVAERARVRRARLGPSPSAPTRRRRPASPARGDPRGTAPPRRAVALLLVPRRHRHVVEHDRAADPVRLLLGSSSSTTTTGAVSPPAASGTVPPSPSTTSGRSTGAVIAARSRPRTQCGTVTGSVRASWPSSFIACTARDRALERGRAGQPAADPIGEVRELGVGRAIGARAAMILAAASA